MILLWSLNPKACKITQLRKKQLIFMSLIFFLNFTPVLTLVFHLRRNIWSLNLPFRCLLIFIYWYSSQIMELWLRGFFHSHCNFSSISCLFNLKSIYCMLSRIKHFISAAYIFNQLIIVQYFSFRLGH
jgi:hypothetical protein